MGVKIHEVNRAHVDHMLAAWQAHIPSGAAPWDIEVAAIVLYLHTARAVQRWPQDADMHRGYRLLVARERICAFASQLVNEMVTEPEDVIVASAQAILQRPTEERPAVEGVRGKTVDDAR